MANFKALVRTPRKDGFYQVYIRVTHNRHVQYIKTDKMVTRKELTKSNEIKDPHVMQYCVQQILEHNEALNKQDISHWTAQEVAGFLVHGKDPRKRVEKTQDFCRSCFIYQLFVLSLHH